MANAVDYSTIPEELKAKRNWLFWKYQTVDGKKRKPPTCVNGKQINPHETNNLYPFSVVQKEFNPKLHEGIGFTLTGSGFVGIDIDDCLEVNNDTSSIKDWARRLLDVIKGNYTEVSPSGNGVKVFIQGKKPNWMDKTHIPIGDGKVEVHDHQYFTVTGKSFDNGDSNKTKQQQIDYFCIVLGTQRAVDLGAFKEKEAETQPPPTPPPVLRSEIEIEERLEKARGSKTGSDFISLYDHGDTSICDNDHSKADLKLCRMLAFWFEKQESLIDFCFSKSALMRDKWHRHSGGGLTYGQRTIQKAIDMTSNTYQPTKSNKVISIHSKTKNEEEAEEVDNEYIVNGKSAVIPGGYGLPNNDPRYFEIPTMFDLASFTDHHFSSEIVKYVGDELRWSSDRGVWLVWTGKFWSDKEHLVSNKLQQVTQIFRGQAFVALAERKLGDKSSEQIAGYCRKKVQKFSNLSRHRSALEYTKPQLAISSLDLNLDQYLLNFQNCTVDLRTGETKEHQKSDYITKIINHDYNPDAKANKWNKFVRDVMGNDDEMVDYVHRVLGYSVNGSTDEQCLFIFYGEGANGKSTLAGTCMRLLGDYSRTVSDDFFCLKTNRGHPTEIAVLQGSRLVLASESQGSKNSTLDEGKVKWITGGDRLVARFMNKDQFEFTPTQTFVMLVNSLPQILGNDKGMWRRLKLIKFEQQFEDDNRIGNMKDLLYAESEGVLAWLVQGAINYYQNGIQEPESVTKASREYQMEFDTVGQFIEECCVVGSGLEIQSSKLYQAYKNWCDENNEKPFGTRQFSTTLERKKFKKRKSGNMLFCGISTKKTGFQGGIREDREDREGKTPDEYLSSQPSQPSLNSPKRPDSVDEFMKLGKFEKINALISLLQECDLNITEANLPLLIREYKEHNDEQLTSEFQESLKFLQLNSRK